MKTIGLMSGTSMDGIDAALLETDGSPERIEEISHYYLAYDPRFKILLKAAEYAIRKYIGDLNKARINFTQALNDYLKEELRIPESVVNQKREELAVYLYGEMHKTKVITLNKVIRHSSKLHEKAVRALLKKTQHKTTDIDVIGYHGQTMFHRPSIKVSVIVGHGQYLANKLGITVVNDFRRRDVAHGGQGAPFAPLYHQALAIRDKKIPLAVVNCGGIANITLIWNDNEYELIGYDTGPGNALIDRLVRQRSGGKKEMDENGEYGRKGVVHKEVLEKLYEKSIIKDGKNYFLTPPPKSLDIGDMSLIPELDSLSLEDACATLEAFTAYTIIKSIELINAELPQHWILAGGGWNNPVIREELTHRLREKIGDSVSVQTADEAGWNSQAMEAQIFAYLAVRSLQNKPLSVPGTTRISQALSGGHAYLPLSGATETVSQLIEKNPAVLSGYAEKAKQTKTKFKNTTNRQLHNELVKSGLFANDRMRKQSYYSACEWDRKDYRAMYGFNRGKIK